MDGGHTGIGQQTRTATILFTDLVGSTALRSRVGDAVAEDIRREHDGMLTAAVMDHEGEIVKHLGDGLMAVFSSATDAVAGAVQMQQAVDRYNRRPIAGEQLAIRVGVSVGDVHVEDADYFGTPVVEAARLEEAAAGGQILCSQVVQLLAGSRAGHRFEAIGELELKGLAAPLATAEVRWDREPAASEVPLPTALAAREGEPFVGRQAEQLLLRRAWTTATAGERRVVLVGGEPGIGKSALVADVARRLHAEGATVLHGRCDEGLTVPYQPIVEALRHDVRATGDDALVTRLGAFGGDLVRLLPELADRVADLPAPLSSDPEIEQFRLFEAVVAWLAALTASGPVLLAIDDVQWASPHTARLIRHVADRATDLPLLIVCTYREGAGASNEESFATFLGSVGRLSGVERLHLAALEARDVAGVLHAAMDDADSADVERLAVQLWEGTGGNAFFVRELVQHLSESGVLDDPSRVGSIADLGVPEGIRAMITRRLSKLSTVAHQVLTVASVMGQEFDLTVLAQVLELDDDELYEALEEAELIGVIGQGAFGRCKFSHALVQAALYEDLSYTRRLRLHRRVGEVLESVYAARLPSRHGELAYHFDHAGTAGDPGKAMRYATLAGEHALDQYANEEAIEFLTIAKRYLDEGIAHAAPDDRCDLELSLGRAQARLARPEHRPTLKHAAALAVELGDVSRATHAVVAAGRSFITPVGEVDEEQVALLERALELSGAGDTPERAMLLARLAAELSYTSDVARPLAAIAEAVDVARRTGDQRALAFVIATRYSAVWDRDTYAGELRSLAADVGDPGLAFLAEHLESNQASWEGDFDLAEGAFARSEALAGAVGDRATWLVELTRAKQAMLRGELDVAEALSAEALAIGQRSRQPDSFAFYASQLLCVRWLQCRSGELASLIDGADDALLAVPAFRAAKAFLQMESGRRSEAKAGLDALAAHGFANQSIVSNPVVPLLVLGHLCADLDDRSHAFELLAALDPYQDLHAGSVNLWLGPAAHPRARLLAMLGEHGRADELFETACAVYAERGLRQMHALAGLHWAEAMVRRSGGARRDADVERLVDQALVIAQEFELDGLTERARAVAVQLTR